MGTSSVWEPVGSLLEDGPAELTPGEETVRELGTAAVLELVVAAELPDGTMYSLEDGPAGPDWVAELLDDNVYPLEDGPAGGETVRVVGTVPV